MKYQTCHSGKIFAVRWFQTDVASLEAVEQEFSSACRRVRDKLVYVSISKDDTPPPDDATRKKMLAGVDVILKEASHFFIVMESRGFRGSVQRTAMAGLMLVYKNSRQIKTCANMDEVFAELENAKIPVNRQQVLKDMATAGL
ncbi:MAG: hypothetical protein AB2A00_19530 [Myxococcota bacterium]